VLVRIGTWNLENLFRHGADGGPRTDAAYQAKLAALANTINVLAPDLLAVQEVGDSDALADLADRTGGGWKLAATDLDGRGIRVGFLSRLELSDVRQIWDFPAGLRPIQVDDTPTTISTMGRPALRARVQAGGRAIDLITCHLKSKLLSFPGGRFSTRDEDERARFGVYALNRARGRILRRCFHISYSYNLNRYGRCRRRRAPGTRRDCLLHHEPGVRVVRPHARNSLIIPLGQTSSFGNQLFTRVRNVNKPNRDTSICARNCSNTGRNFTLP
jgi:hypothetical protein